MEYPVLIERRNGLWRAFIPSLGGVEGEGASRDEALRNAKRAAEEFLSKFEVTTLELLAPDDPKIRPGDPRALLLALDAFAGDRDALREHFDQLAADRLSQREEAQREGHE
jgi:predicted RNase H-like HicB family nuclease